MKSPRILIYITALIIIIFSISTTSNSQSGSDRYRKDVEIQRDSAARDLNKVREEIDQIKKMIKEKHLKFRVDMTDAIKQRIQDITGLKRPLRLEYEASKQKTIGELRLKEYMSRRSKKLHNKVRGEAPSISEDEEYQFKPDEGTEPIEDNSSSRNDNAFQEKDSTDRSITGEEEKIVPPSADADKSIKQDEKKDVGFLANPSQAAFNWRDVNKLTPIRHQKTCGSCWAFTSVAILEASYKIQVNRAYDLSEQYLVDCAVDNEGQRAGSCDGGWYGGAFESMQRYGAAEEAISPYRNANSSCPGLRGTSYKVAAWGFIKNDGGVPGIDEMKKAITKYGAIATCVKVTPAFQGYVGGIFDEHTRLSAPNDVNHAIVIVGWDDTKGARGSYLLRNSWGPKWGENGYMWIEYGCNGVGFGAAWAVADVQK